MAEKVGREPLYRVGDRLLAQQKVCKRESLKLKRLMEEFRGRLREAMDLDERHEVILGGEFNPPSEK